MKDLILKNLFGLLVFVAVFPFFAVGWGQALQWAVWPEPNRAFLVSIVTLGGISSLMVCSVLTLDSVFPKMQDKDE